MLKLPATRGTQVIDPLKTIGWFCRVFAPPQPMGAGATVGLPIVVAIGRPDTYGPIRTANLALIASGELHMSITQL
jgi:hypothetical protein